MSGQVREPGCSAAGFGWHTGCARALPAERAASTLEWADDVAHDPAAVEGASLRLDELTVDVHSSIRLG